MPDKFRLSDNGIERMDLRVMIFREIISNTLLHREYVSSYSNKFLIFRDRVITENWTKPFQTGDIDISDWRTRTKNPLITKVFRAMKWAEELGSGQKNIRKYAPMYYDKTEIEIHSGEEFIFSITYRDPKEFEIEDDGHQQVTDKSSARSWQRVGKELARSWQGVSKDLWHY
jgi:ATP-dependent DNA helicase RecG